VLVQAMQSDRSSVDEIDGALFAHASGLSWVAVKRKGRDE
jgi:hypothetical protein